eukprot:SAG11_NODE_1623_length_4559_cov_2.141480_2_plen_200_part_00
MPVYINAADSRSALYAALLASLALTSHPPQGQLSVADLTHKRRDFYDVIEFLLECEDQVPADHDGGDRPTVGAVGGGNPRTVGVNGYRPMLNTDIKRQEAERAGRAKRPSSSGGSASGGGNGGGGEGGGGASGSRAAVALGMEGSDSDDDDPYDCNTGRQVRYLQLEINRLKKENRQLRQEKRSVETIYQQVRRPHGMS